MAMNSERKTKRRQILEKKKEVLELMKAASLIKDPVAYFPAFLRYDRSGHCMFLESGRGDKLSRSLKQYIRILLKLNMEEHYGCEWPTEEKVKYRELVAPEARYIFIHHAHNPQNNDGKMLTSHNENQGNVVGFVHYRFTIEEELPVLYVYELQLEQHVQGKGLGKFLMQLLELIARKTGMAAVMLTVQKSNLSAMAFYISKLRYSISAISPSRVDPLMDSKNNYEILCKTFDPDAKSKLELECWGQLTCTPQLVSGLQSSRR